MAVDGNVNSCWKFEPVTVQIKGKQMAVPLIKYVFHWDSLKTNQVVRLKPAACSLGYVFLVIASCFILLYYTLLSSVFSNVTSCHCLFPTCVMACHTLISFTCPSLASPPSFSPCCHLSLPIYLASLCQVFKSCHHIFSYILDLPLFFLGLACFSYYFLVFDRFVVLFRVFSLVLTFACIASPWAFL